MGKATPILLALLFTSIEAFAQAAGGGVGDKGYYALGLGLMVGLGALGATMGQGKVGSAAMEGLARNPQARGSMFLMFILGFVLIESLYILTWVIGIMITTQKI